MTTLALFNRTHQEPNVNPHPNTTPTRPDDLQPGDQIVWIPTGGTAEVAHILVPTDQTPTSRTVELAGGGSIRCHQDDEFYKI